MKRPIVGALVAALFALSVGPALAAGSDDLDFFEEEAKVVTAAHQPHAASDSPATVYVVTAEDIRASQAQTWCDLFRTVPGVNVVQSTTFQCQVSIRGLNAVFNNRTLVLLDGKSVLRADYDYVLWESLPVTLAEVERIEIVEGPASALYGANAVNGVINIITKTPEQLKGGLVSYSGGGENAQFGTALYGNRTGALDYKLGAGWRSGDRFDSGGQLGSESQRADGLIGYDLADDSRLSLSGGAAKYDVYQAAGPIGSSFSDGLDGFLRADYKVRDTSLRLFWNHEHSDEPQENGVTDETTEVYDATLEHSLSLPGGNQLTVGANARHESLLGGGYSPNPVKEDLWALYFEDEWRPGDRWSVTASGRLDHHPLTGFNFSPRASVLYRLADSQTLRATAGTSFRNPDLVESNVNAHVTLPNPPGGALPNPPFSALQVSAVGNPALSPERMAQAELAYNGQFGPVKASLVGYCYRLTNLIIAGSSSLTLVPPDAVLQSSYINQGEIRAWGYEAALEAPLTSALGVFANYSYVSERDAPANFSFGPSALSDPRHKVNAGAKWKRGGLTGSLRADWVDKTLWPNQSNSYSYDEVPSYFLLNFGVDYRFSGAWQGWELGASASNMLNNRHYETLPAAGGLPGQNGEILGGRWMGTLAYRF
jgi:outer membrane receptor for ferrienterochelin and colicin